MWLKTGEIGGHRKRRGRTGLNCCRREAEMHGMGCDGFLEACRSISNRVATVVAGYGHICCVFVSLDTLSVNRIRRFQKHKDGHLKTEYLQRLDDHVRQFFVLCDLLVYVYGCIHTMYL